MDIALLVDTKSKKRSVALLQSTLVSRNSLGIGVLTKH